MHPNKCDYCGDKFGLTRRLISPTNRQYCVAYCEAWGEREYDEKRQREIARFLSWLYPSSWVYTRPP